ncbi:MAG: efflux RND transporter periplasmic adaptor subunit [Bacteroidota bacterium]
MKNTIKIAVFVALGVLFIYTIYFLYNKNKEQPIVFNTLTAFETDIVKKTLATGSIVPRREINIKPQVSGIIEKIYVVAGTLVKKGDMIARIKIIPNMINLANAESRITRAKLALDNAKIDFERNQKMFDQRMISLSEFQPFNLAYKNAKEELEAADNNIALIKEGVSKSGVKITNTIVRSTIEGMILDIPVKEGGSVIESNNFNEGTTIASIADMGEMIFDGKVDESEVGKIKQGMNLILTIGALDTVKFDANLEYIAPKGIKENGAIQFQIKAKVNLQKGVFLRAGYSSTADIVLASKKNVLAISESVLQFENNKTFVEVETAPQVFEKRLIQTGLSDGINIEILSGIKKGEKVKNPNVEKAE